MKSEIVKNKEEAEELSVDVIEKKLDEWVLEIREALVFLNHVTEFSYYVVDKDQHFNLKCQYKLSMDSAAVESRASMFKCVKGFKEKRQPDVFNYLINYNCISSLAIESTPTQPCETYEEQWFIQQGVGDIGKPPPEQKWQYINRVLPKHGIATPVNVSQQLIGKLFCFLPLQTYSGLPVHINGQFMLSSNRRSLWAGSPKGEFDEKRDCNDLLFDAIASSYVRFMTEVQGVVVKDDEYADKDIFYTCINKYYGSFPMWEGANLEKQNCLGMAKLVFQQIWQSNVEVLAVETHCKKDAVVEDQAPVFTIKVEWNNLRNEQDPFKQVYFQPQLGNEEEKQKVITLLRRINMTLTCAPHIFYKNLITEDETKPSIATPESVFQFYCSFHSQIIPQGCPCPIEDTPFKTGEMFHQFIKYMLVVAKPDSTEKQFPRAPFGYPLLLTADNVLRCFDPQNKVIRSVHSKLFPKSLSSFLHEVFRWPEMDSEYFLVTKEIKFSPGIENLLMVNLPNELLQNKVKNSDENICIGLKDLRCVWKCLTSESDPLLKNHRTEVLRTWALTPATNGYLYSTRCSTLPIMPPCLGQLDSVDKAAYNIFISVGLPVIDNSELPSDCGLLNTCQAYFPTIKHYDQVLMILYHLHQEQDILDSISSKDVRGILKYFQRTGFIHNEQLKDQILALPLFISIEGRRTSLRDKKVYLWPHSGFCDAGYNRWGFVVFLEYKGDWRALTNDFASIAGKSLDEKEIYIDLVFPCFGKLSSDERKQHLEYIMERIYPYLKHSENIAHHNKYFRQQIEFDLLFFNTLKSLKCIEHPRTQHLYRISDFSDHTIKVFQVFSNSFIFLPRMYQEDKWYKFFCDFGLQTTLDIQFFINFCSKVQDGSHDIVENIDTASKVLLEYLFSSKAREWDDDSLQVIADISFVKVAEVPHLSWIKAPCSPPHVILPAGIKLTKLNQSVVFEAAPLIWTVKPVFKQSPVKTRKENYWDRVAFLQKLSVTSSPSLDDIVANLVSISKSHVANFDLFNAFKPECIPTLNQLSLLDVVTKCLDKLKECSSELLSPLKDCACVPVFAKQPNVVLVRPIQVVNMFLDQNDVQFKPHINVLPDNLMSYCSVFEKIGVHSTIDLIHVRHVLDTLHSRFGEGNRTDDPNVIQLIRHSIVKLLELLPREEGKSKQNTIDQLSPLYLPFSTRQCMWSLKSSDNLVFVGSFRYQFRQPTKFNLAETNYSLFEIPEDTSIQNSSIERGQMNHAALKVKKFCLALPTKVRPQQLSLSSLEKRVSVGSILDTGTHNIAIEYLTQSKGFLETLDNLEKILMQMFLYHMTEPDPEMQSAFIRNFCTILRNINFMLIKGLQARLIFKNKEIGTLTSPKYVLEREQEDHDCKYTLFVDHSVKGEREFFKELSQTILIEVARLTNTNLTSYFKMAEPISRFFQAHSLQELADEYEVDLPPGGLALDTEDENTSLKPIFGKTIPDEFLGRLENSINNIFYPQEWVAYEVTEENFVWARIRYPVIIESGEQLDRYTIAVNTDNEDEEIEVSVVALYKILPKIISETEPTADEQALALVVANKDGDSSNLTKLVNDYSKSLHVAIKHSICTTLRMISLLTDGTEITKAMKRLYLQYHPDKVSEPNKEVYKKVFPFVKYQIGYRLKEGKPFEDHDDGNDPFEPTSVYQSLQVTSPQFDQWDNYIPRRSLRAYALSQKNDANQANERLCFDLTEFQTKSDENEAKRWLRQSKADYSAMKILLEQKHQYKPYCQIVFLAHEVIEKSLKAGMYKLVGLDPEYLSHHRLCYLAKCIASQRHGARELPSNLYMDHVISLVDIANWIEHFYLDSRYPNKHPEYDAPVDVCSREDAETAANYAVMTLDFFNSLM